MPPAQAHHPAARHALTYWHFPLESMLGIWRRILAPPSRQTNAGQAPQHRKQGAVWIADWLSNKATMKLFAVSGKNSRQGGAPTILIGIYTKWVRKSAPLADTGSYQSAPMKITPHFKESGLFQRLASLIGHLERSLSASTMLALISVSPRPAKR